MNRSILQHQRPKAGLRETLIGRQGVRRAMLLHHRERQAIRQAPSLVHPRPEQRHGLPRLSGRCSHDATWTTGMECVPGRDNKHSACGSGKCGPTLQQVGIRRPQFTTADYGVFELARADEIDPAWQMWGERPVRLPQRNKSTSWNVIAANHCTFV